MPHSIHYPDIPYSRRLVLPSLNDTVDVYWPDCGRFFRGSLVAHALEKPFEFYIHYEDDDFQQTDLNGVRWHYAKGTYTSRSRCCDQEQEILHNTDCMPGDLKMYYLANTRRNIEMGESASRVPVERAHGSITKQRRRNPDRKARQMFKPEIYFMPHDFRDEEKGSGKSDPRSPLLSSNGHETSASDGGKFVVPNAEHLKCLKKTVTGTGVAESLLLRCSADESGFEGAAGSENIGDEEAQENFTAANPQVHWKKKILSKFHRQLS